MARVNDPELTKARLHLVIEEMYDRIVKLWVPVRFGKCSTGVGMALSTCLCSKNKNQEAVVI